MSRWIGGDGGVPTCDIVLQGGGAGSFQAVVDRIDGNHFSGTGITFGDEHPTRTITIALFVRGDYSTDIPGTGVVDTVSILGEPATVISHAFGHSNGSGAKYHQITFAYVRKATGTTGSIAWEPTLTLNSNSSSVAVIYASRFLKRTPITSSARGVVDGSTGYAVAKLAVPARASVLGAFIRASSFGGLRWDGRAEGNDFMQGDGGTFDDIVYGTSVNFGSNAYGYNAHTVAPSANEDFGVQVTAGLGNIGILSAVSLR